MPKQTDIISIQGVDPGRMVFRISFFSFTLFLSASLMFMVQPMIGKMMLPVVGGAPSGWLVAMAFFQLLLLAGYVFAHILSRLPSHQHASIVLLVLIVGLAMLPLKLVVGTVDSTATPNPMRVVVILACSVSLPFFALSTVSSSLQRLFSVAWACSVPDPYFLFAASNLGSFFGLLIYPLWLERHYGLISQSHDWQIGYIALIVLCALCLAVAYRMAKTEKTIATNTIFSPEISWRQRGFWVALAAIPSSLLLGITAHITLDQGSLPLFWVLPLALYLLTFVVAFARHQFLRFHYLNYLQPLLLACFVFAFLLNPFTISANRNNLILPVIVFFLTALLCHMRLAATRPAAEKLTEFYLWVAVGGALGGCFNAFIVPYLFPLPVEFILVALASCFLFPVSKALSGKAFLIILCIASIIGGGAVIFSGGINSYGIESPDNEIHSPFSIEIILTALTCYVVHPARFAHLKLRPRVYRSLAGLVVSLALAEVAIANQNFSDAQLPGAIARVVLIMALAYVSFWPRILATLAPVLGLLAVLTHQGPHLVDLRRNFFGVWRVYDELYDYGQIKVRVLYHGSTKHGAEKLTPEINTTPNGYYDVNGPLGDLISHFQPSDIGIVGIGAGTTLCYQAPGRHYTVYEIDPDVVTLSAKWFDFIRTCGMPEIRIGDGRQLLAAAKTKQHDMLTIDAFSSDTIPIHLLTKEAFQIYFERMKPDGILAFHISNRYYDLRMPISNIVNELGLYALTKSYASPKLDPTVQMSSWVVVSRSDAPLAPLRNKGWKDLPAPQGKVWTDDYSDALSALKPSSFFQMTDPEHAQTHRH